MSKMTDESNRMKPGFWVLALALLAFWIQAQRLEAWGGAPANSALGAVGTVWGGEHVELEVTANGANLDFDCATGTISGALVPDGQGKFAMAGALVRERPGPTMRGGNPTARAKYAGVLHGETLHLVVSVEGSNEPYGEYVLTRGKPGRVVKCLMSCGYFL